MQPNDGAIEELRVACIAGDIAQIERLFAAGRVDADDATHALDDYVDQDDVVLIRCLLEHKADPNSVDICLVDSGEILRLLVDYGYDLKTRGHLILHYFAGDRDTLDWMLDQGVDINLTTTRQLDHGFNLAPGEHDYSIKLLNVVSERGDIPLFDHLVSRGASPSKSLALHRASKHQDHTAAMLVHLLDKYDMVIDADTDTLRQFFHQDSDSGTPLCSAIYNKNLAAVTKLLSRGADPERCGTYGYPPVIKAIRDADDRCFLPALKPLLEAGADLTDALRYAVHSDSIEAVRICLEAGADPASGLESASERKRHLIEGFLVSHSADRSKADCADGKASKAMLELMKTWMEK